MAKKRGLGEGSITKIPNGTFQARIEMGRNENGNRIRKARYFKRKKEAQVVLYSALEQAYENELIVKNPASHVKLPRREKPQIKVLTL